MLDSVNWRTILADGFGYVKALHRYTDHGTNTKWLYRKKFKPNSVSGKSKIIVFILQNNHFLLSQWPETPAPDDNLPVHNAYHH